MTERDQIDVDTDVTKDVKAAKIPDIEIEVEDDTPEQDRGKERRKPDSKPDIPDDDEIAKHSENVQKRLKHLKWEYHEERRAKEEAERLREQAVEFARQQHNELAKLRRILADGENEHVKTSKESAAARLTNAKAALRAANESGDSEAIANAQEELAKAVSANERWSGYQPRYQIDPNDPRVKPLPPQQRPQFQPPRPTSQAMAWAEENPWFQKDERMTAYAFAVHKELVEKEGIAPDTEEYYNKLDEEMHKTFPSAFEGRSQSRQKQPSQPGTVVAAGSRTPGKPRRIKLTQTQVALARRLGITPEAYAAELLKQETGQ